VAGNLKTKISDIEKIHALQSMKKNHPEKKQLLDGIILNYRKIGENMVWQKVGYPSQEGELYIKSSGMGEIGVCEVDEEGNKINKCIWWDDIDKAKKGINEINYRMQLL